MIKVGITGGIGSGKTTVLHFFKRLGVPAYIADERARALMHKSPLKEEIIHRFGTDSFDQKKQLNRAFLAHLVFTNPDLLKQLNELVHPRVAQDFQTWVQNQKAPYIIYEAAILFETGGYKTFDYTILVTAPKKVRIFRLKKRDATSEEKIRKRMQNQWPDEKKEKLADWVIINRDLADTQQQVLRLHNILSRN